MVPSMLHGKKRPSNFSQKSNEVIKWIDVMMWRSCKMFCYFFIYYLDAKFWGAKIMSWGDQKSHESPGWEIILKAFTTVPERLVTLTEPRYDRVAPVSGSVTIYRCQRVQVWVLSVFSCHKFFIYEPVLKYLLSGVLIWAARLHGLARS